MIHRLNALLTTLAVLLGLLAAMPSWAAPAPNGPANSVDPTAEDPTYPYTRPNPDAEIGKLDNGLTYGVMRRAGTRQVSIILYVGAGSMDETESERGVAHFLEHMAFNGSQHFPPGTVMKRFADIGVSIGRDQDAETSFDNTTFSLDISEITPDRLDMGFAWLRDVADGLLILPSEVDRERGVIMSEYIGSRGAMAQIADSSEEFMLPGLLGPKREPIGLKEVISTVNADTIRHFHDTWYRPENSIVVAVGDVPPEELKQRIIAAFGSWRNPNPAPAKVDLGHVDPERRTAVLVETDSRVPPTLQVCRAMDKDPDEREGVDSRTRDFETGLWQTALSTRLSALANGADPPFVGAEVGRDPMFDAADVACVSISLRDDDWKRALAAVSAETRRLAKYGLTEDEYEQGRKALVAQVEAEVGEAPTMTGAQLAQSIVANLTEGGTFSTAEEDQRIGRLALAKLTRDGVDAEFNRVWTDAGKPTIVLVTSQPQHEAPVLTAWKLAEAGPPPAPPAEHQGHPWAYASFGPPGTVVSTEPLPDIDATRIAFANGVRLNFKSSQNAQDRVEIRIRFGAGQQELAAKDLPAARLGASLLREGGLGKNDYEDTVRFCESHACDFELSVGRDAFEIAGATRPVDLDVELQLIAAYLSDPGFRPDLDARIPTAVHTLYELSRSEPDVAAAMARSDALPPPRIPLLPAEQDLDHVRSADFARILGPALKHDALEVTIVGDIDQATAVQAVAKTLGALPPRQWKDTARPDAPKIRYPAPSDQVVMATHDGSPEKATVLATWPLFVWRPDKVREQRTLDLLGQILQGQAIDDIRQRLGKAYSPVVEMDLSRGGDQGSMTVSIDTAPDATAVVVGELRRIAQNLASGDITEAMLERARRPVLDNGATREISNPWWIDMLDGSWAHPDQIAAAASWESDFETISLDEVKAEAKQYLAPEPLIVVASPATQASAALVKPKG
ncbi:MAG TPA: insulinase family protein [Caulobacteraceae bacterium]|nr:insulinase family protein [Caulobacteraceae bacterium]